MSVPDRPAFDPDAFSARVAKLQRQFDLDYQATFLVEADHFIGLAGKQVLEVGGSLPSELVLNEIGAFGWTCLVADSYYREINDDANRASATAGAQPLATAGLPGPGYRRYEGLIENAPGIWDGAFDAIFSIATFEHLLDLPGALDRCFALLRPGGALYSRFSPIWSSAEGHHLPGICDDAGNLVPGTDHAIPPFGHLLMRPAEKLDAMSQRFGRTAARRIVY